MNRAGPRHNPPESVRPATRGAPSEAVRAAVEEALASLAPKGVAVAVCRIGDAPISPPQASGPGERKPSRRRRAEFAAGRVGAALALEALGVMEAPVPQAGDGAPDWPAGTAGSISHSGGLAGAVAARIGPVEGLGLDLERDGFLAPESAPLFCGDAELQWLRHFEEPARGRMALILFAAKESAQKCARPFLGRLPNPTDLALRVDPEAPRFTACLPGEPAGAGTLRIAGRYTIREGFVLALSVAPGTLLGSFTSGRDDLLP